MLQLNKKINRLGLFAPCYIGLPRPENSLSMMGLPGGDEVVYMSGVKDKHYQVQISAKSQDQLACMNALMYIYQEIERLTDLPSENGSYDFQSISAKALPNLVGQDEQGFFVYVLNISAKISIYEGVGQ